MSLSTTVRNPSHQYVPAPNPCKVLGATEEDKNTINSSFKYADEFSSPIYLGEVSGKNEEASQDDGLIVGDVELLGDGGRGESGTEDDCAGFGDEARRRDRLDDFLGAFGRRSGLCGHGTPGNMQ